MKIKGGFFIVFAFVCFVFIASAEISIEEEDYIKSLIEKQGIENVSNITKLNESFLPERVDVSSVEENQIGIYEIEYDEFGDKKSVFVVSYLSEEIIEVVDYEVQRDFYFTLHDEDISSSSFLTNYVMLESGFITGLSTFASLSGEGKIFVYIYRNGELINFFNEINSDDINTIDFDLQSVGLNNFNQGDILSLYVRLEGGVFVDEIDSILKVTR